jgi:hypothetical protein
MSDWPRAPRGRHDDISIPAIRVAFALSLLLHGIALWTWLPRMRLLAPSNVEQGETGSPLAVELVPRQSPQSSMPTISPPSEGLLAQPSPSHAAAPPPKAAARPPSAPPMMSLARTSPDIPAQRDAAATPPSPASESDLSSYIESRRRARGESASQGSTTTAPPAEDENERMNRIIAANIGASAKPSFGSDPKNGGGLFQMKEMDDQFAEFYFFGWNRDISRNSKQLIEVRKGNNSDIRIAVIRRMIAIVREYETGDFLWESPRLGRQLMLSARQRDNAELEAFLMREFFTDPRRRN